jgi:hypothetical protein
MLCPGTIGDTPFLADTGHLHNRDPKNAKIRKQHYNIRVTTCTQNGKRIYLTTLCMQDMHPCISQYVY